MEKTTLKGLCRGVVPRGCAGCAEVVRGLCGGCAGMLVSVKVHEKLNHVALHSISPLL